ncbi:MAG: hypothetical protein ACREDM_09800 [Methylocella sp.]
MSTTFRSTVSGERSAYGGFVDALGGVATVVLSVFGLAGTRPGTMIAVAIIVFGVSLLIQGGTMASGYAGIRFPAATPTTSEGSTLSAVFMAGAAGIILGILALLGLAAATLAPVAIIVFGAGLALSSTALSHLYAVRRAVTASEAEPTTLAGSEILASEMAYGSGGLQVLAGLAAIVLGILAIAGAGADDRILILVGLLVLGATLVITGGTITGILARSTARPPATRTYST